MTKNECINCTKANYRGKDAGGNLRFGCNSPYCVKEDIVPNPYHNEIINELSKNNKTGVK